MEEFCNEVKVVRNDELNMEEIWQFDKIIISPGPGLPQQAGKLMQFLATFHKQKSILGVCLGMQAIGEFYGAQLKNMEEVKHGVSSLIHITSSQEPLYQNLPQQFMVGRYHSWAVSSSSLANTGLEITSLDEEKEVMSLAHKTDDVRGVQFHPESILTEYGKKIIFNWLMH